jgi:hypothetical protein
VLSATEKRQGNTTMKAMMNGAWRLWRAARLAKANARFEAEARQAMRDWLML